MRYRLLAADSDLLREAFADLLDPAPAQHEVEVKDPFTCKIRRARVDAAAVDTELIVRNSWETDSPTRLIERALGCSAAEAASEVEIVRQAEDWTLMSVSAAATRALTTAAPAQLGGYEIALRPGQRLYVYWDD